MPSRKEEYQSILWNLRIFVVANEWSWRGPVTHSEFNQVVKDIRSSIRQTLYRQTERMAQNVTNMTEKLSEVEARYQADLEVWRYFFVKNVEVTRDLPEVMLDRGYQVCCDEQRQNGLQYQKPIQLQEPSMQQQQTQFSTNYPVCLPVSKSAAPKPSAKTIKQDYITRVTKSKSKTKINKILLDNTEDLGTRIQEKESEEESLRATGYAEWEKLMDLARDTKLRVLVGSSWYSMSWGNVWWLLLTSIGFLSDRRAIYRVQERSGTSK
ncbi:hypothetical protein OCU04_001301 [Sclerotinia nivalis]|uniref:Uncharacterized protein n=1 Tax=Sclerotinia nivalis TaxID=352851 RepID=A0A9X0AYZ2_9HELO|nr:hypothetical protein OCU04_001301 [Sclerotinia nivalis]